ncbi:MAG: EAL domain-containing protein, partial [Pseudomonadota bacterium]
LEHLDGAAMRAAALALQRITALGFTETYVSFNASTHALSGAGLLDDMIWTAAELQVAPERLVIEVLETVFFGDDATETRLAHQIEQLRQAGFRAMLDDFGVGYAGLAHLGQLEINGLKIDRSLIRKIKTGRAEAVIVRAILNLARDLGLGVVAEGVEDADMAKILKAQGCRLAQGYHIARPMTLEKLEGWLTTYAAQHPRAARG